MADHSERRTRQRFDKVFAVYVTGVYGTCFGIARNISTTGMFLDVPDPYPLGSRMTITFQWPGTQTELTVLAEVVHVSLTNVTGAGQLRSPQIGCGVRFIGLVDDGPQAGAGMEMQLMQ